MDILGLKGKDSRTITHEDNAGVWTQMNNKYYESRSIRGGKNNVISHITPFMQLMTCRVDLSHVAKAHMLIKERVLMRKFCKLKKGMS